MLVGPFAQLLGEILDEFLAVDVGLTVALHGKDASTASEFASTGGCRFLIICV